jgi:DNA-binding transcriptional regulator YhcF (GntR family)
MPRTEISDLLRSKLRVDRASEIPIGTQLSWTLERLIGSGTLRPGEQLPSVRQLAVAAGVNVNTIRSVYARLEERGLLDSEHGRGTFVRGAADEPGKRSDREYRRELMRQIAELERQVAYYTRHRPLGSLEPPARGRPASQLLPAGELMEIRDELQERVAELRRAEEERLTRVVEVRAAVAAEEAEERAEEIRAPARRTRGTVAEPPRVVFAPGAWALRWRT